jgi:hypothetical protein
MPRPLDQSHIDEAIAHVSPEVLELGRLTLDAIYARLNAARIRSGLTWEALGREAKARPWTHLGQTVFLNLADLTNYIVWLSQHEQGHERP